MHASEFILAETRLWIAVNKPAGISVERQQGAKDTLEDLVLAYLKKSNARPFLGIVHRLDRPTSGVVLMAKKQSALTLLNEQFRQGSTQKRYLALTQNGPSTPQGTLRHWLIKDQKEKKSFILPKPDPAAVEVRLHYKILQSAQGTWLWEIHLLTGKFHQIRAQLAEIGCPVLGDTLYGGQPLAQFPDQIALHAWKLSFSDPESEKTILLNAPLPQIPAWMVYTHYFKDKV